MSTKRIELKEPLTLECDYSTRLLDWGRRRVKKESLLILYSPFLHSYLNHTRLTFVHRQSFYFSSLTFFWSRFQLQKNNAGWCPFLCHRLSLKKVFLEFYFTSKSPSILRRSSAGKKLSFFWHLRESEKRWTEENIFGLLPLDLCKRGRVVLRLEVYFRPARYSDIGTPKNQMSLFTRAGRRRVNR